MTEIEHKSIQELATAKDGLVLNFVNELVAAHDLPARWDDGEEVWEPWLRCPSFVDLEEIQDSDFTRWRIDLPIGGFIEVLTYVNYGDVWVRYYDHSMRNLVRFK